MNIAEAIQAQIDGRLVRMSYLLYIDCTEPVRVWNGVGPKQVSGWGPDLTGGLYLGIGDIVDIPALSQLVNGVAGRVEFTLSGLNEALKDGAESDADAVRGAETSVGAIFLDADWQPLSTPITLWTGEADMLKTDTQYGETAIRTITLSVGSATTGRRRPQFSAYTRAQQRARSSDDASCDRVGLYTEDTTLAWPP